MPIANYKTKVPTNRTVSEIQEMLIRNGAGRIMVDYDNSQPNALSFTLPVDGRQMPFRLPNNWEGVREALLRDLGKRKIAEDHARAVSWRILRDWVRAQIAIIQSGQVKPAEAFLQYMITDNGQTLFQRFEGNTKLLPAGKVD